jgi:hypothetical protein
MQRIPYVYNTTLTLIKAKVKLKLPDKNIDNIIVYDKARRVYGEL